MKSFRTWSSKVGGRLGANAPHASYCNVQATGYSIRKAIAMRSIMESFHWAIIRIRTQTVATSTCVLKIPNLGSPVRFFIILFYLMLASLETLKWCAQVLFRPTDTVFQTSLVHVTCKFSFTLDHVPPRRVIQPERVSHIAWVEFSTLFFPLIQSRSPLSHHIGSNLISPNLTGVPTIKR